MLGFFGGLFCCEEELGFNFCFFLMLTVFLLCDFLFGEDELS